MNVLQEGKIRKYECEPVYNSDKNGLHDRHNLIQRGFSSSSSSSSVSSPKSSSSSSCENSTLTFSSDITQVKSTDSSTAVPSMMADNHYSYSLGKDVAHAVNDSVNNKDITLLQIEWKRQLNLKIRDLSSRLESQRNILTALSCQVPSESNPFAERIFYIQVSTLETSMTSMMRTCLFFTEPTKSTMG